jgi:2-desacetyl-2-hydroxyethyl bacteriochlorophyllide A dehydrogenase
MRSIICEQPERFAVVEKPVPVRAPGEALLKVKRVGICGTDLHAFKGNQPFFSYPRVLGHELAVEVQEVDTNPQGLKPGDKAVVIPYINCTTCAACRAGKSNCCENIKVFGVHTDGGMQEAIVLPTRLLLPANDLSYDEIAIVEPLAIGAHALRRAGTKAGEIVVVAGCGPIGMGIVQLAKYLGAVVVAMDVNEHRLAMAQKAFGADFTVHAAQDPAAKLLSYTYGQLAHTVIDATGSKGAIEHGTNYMRHGGTLVLVGIFKGEIAFHHPSIHAKETTLMCSRNATHEDFDFVLKVLRAKKFNTSAYITQTVKAEAILTDFTQWSSPTSPEIKVMTEW